MQEMIFIPLWSYDMVQFPVKTQQSTEVCILQIIHGIAIHMLRVGSRMAVRQKTDAANKPVSWTRWKACHLYTVRWHIFFVEYISQHYSRLSCWTSVIRCQCRDLTPLTPGNRFCKYADDTYLIIPASNINSRTDEIDNIHTWASTNNLNLHLKKSVEIVFVDVVKCSYLTC